MGFGDFLLLLHTGCQLLILGFLLLAFFLEGFLPHLFDIGNAIAAHFTIDGLIRQGFFCLGTLFLRVIRDSSSGANSFFCFFRYLNGSDFSRLGLDPIFGQRHFLAVGNLCIGRRTQQ